MLGNIIAAIVIGIIAGYLGRLLLPGKDPMGFVGTVIAYERVRFAELRERMRHQAAGHEGPAA